MVVSASRQVKRRWRNYATASGYKPAAAFIDGLPDLDAAEVHAAMKDVRDRGKREGRHLRGDIWEVRAEGPNGSYRVLFAAEGKKSRILLSVHAFAKRTQPTPDRDIRLAERRLADWRARGQKQP